MVIITTRHGTHAKLVIESLNAGKNTFVEKPLALNHNELNQIIKTYSEQQKIKKGQMLTVGLIGVFHHIYKN